MVGWLHYSAVARNATGQPIFSSAIGIQISILKGSAAGPIQYQENHAVTTDAFGLFNLVIGAGSIQSGSMSGISWSNDNYFLQVGMDSNGGTNFITMGTTQLLSVPYALHAKTADSVISSGGTGSNCGTCFTHFIGEQYGGGVIFHLWKDAQSIEHGLVVDLVNLSDSQIWSDLDTVLIGPSAQSFWDGLNNSLSIVAQQGHTNSAALLCLNSNNAGQNDWYLPSIQELNLLWNNSYNVERSLSQIAGATSLGNREYWSSTEFDDLMSCFFAFDLGTTSNGLFIYRYKNDYHEVRAVRAF